MLYFRNYSKNESFLFVLTVSESFFELSTGATATVFTSAAATAVDESGALLSLFEYFGFLFDFFRVVVFVLALESAYQQVLVETILKSYFSLVPVYEQTAQRIGPSD